MGTLLNLKTDPESTDATGDSTRFRTQYADLEPDEFLFNFGEYSGSFMLNEQGTWVFRGNNPNDFKLSVSVTTGFDVQFVPQITCVVYLPRVITGFTITTTDGTQYKFGGDKTSIDFTYNFSDPSSLHSSEAMFASAWQLTQIKYTSGKEINFSYEKDGFSLTINRSKELVRYSGFYWKNSISNFGVSNLGYSDRKQGNMLIGSYLKKIETPYEVINFEKEVLSGYADYGNIDNPTTNGIPEYQTINTNFCTDIHTSSTKRKWFRLNTIKCYAKVNNVITSTLLRQIKLNYIDGVASPTTTNPKRRLRLDAVQQVNVDDNSTINLASFAYNTQFLPDYNVAQIDNWGYYNGKNSAFNSNEPTNTYVDNYPSYREPDINYGKAEILEQINYPTGGYTKFEYQPHDYRAAITRDLNVFDKYTPYQIKDDYTSNQPAGGLRIWKITSNDGNQSIVKEYLYCKNYISEPSNLVSSGVLDGLPKYFDQFPIDPNDPNSPKDLIGTNGKKLTVTDFKYMNEQSLNPLNFTEGSPVTYSEVVEKLSDGSFTIYKFSNSDVGSSSGTNYRNLTANDYKTQNNTNFVNKLRDPSVDFGQLRGRLLEQSVYNNYGKILKKINNTYSDALYYDHGIKAIVSRLANINVTFTENGTNYPYNFREVRAIYYSTPTDPNYLLNSTATDYYYDPVTQAPSEMSIVTVNTYDKIRKNILEQKITNINDGEPKSNVTTSYSYAYDAISDANAAALTMNSAVTETITGTKQLMIDKFMIGIPLEIKNNFNKGSKVEYKSFSITNNSIVTNAVLPYIFYSQNQTGSGFIEQFRINGYQNDNYDKPTTTTQKGFTIPIIYSCTNGLLTEKKIKVTTPTPPFYTPATELKWLFSYDQNKRLLTEKTTENGLKTKFTIYDGYRRLKTVVDRMKTDDSDPQAKMEYDYHLQTSSTDYNYIQTKVTYADGYPGNLTTPTLTPMISKQFIDGLGRPFMAYRKDYTQDATLKHQKTYMTYDALGRPNKSYQPFGSPDTDVNLANDAAYLAATYFVQPTYEASPLSRPLEQTMEDGKKVRIRYATNKVSEVRQFTGVSSTAFNTAPSITYLGEFAANTLSKTSVWNENASPVFASDPNSDTKIGRTDVYKDKLGRVVLTRKYVNAAFDEVNTYNVYDTYGNLVMVIPPGAENGGAITTELTFQYIYDNQNRLRGKKVPNAAWQYFYYDNRDLLVLTQDGNMATKPDPDFVLGTKYLGTEYDDIGRVVKTGFVPVSGDPSVYLESNIVTIPEATYLTKNVYYQDKNWVNFTYNRVLTASGVTPPKATLYTEYDQVRPNLYNYKGFPYWVNQENLFGFDDMNQDFNGAGKPTYSNRYIFIGTESQYSNYAHTWEVHKYDKGLRPKENSHQFYNAITATNLQTIDQLNLFSYDTQDRLTRKDIGKSTAYGNKYLQSTNYAYNARGWLGAINPNFLSTLNDYPIFDCNSDEDVLTTNYPFSYSLPSSNSGEDNPDLFTENVIYDGPDYTIPGAQASQYNGNISQITWQVAGREKQAYSFKYDNLDRLLEANYADIHGNYQYHHWNSPFKSDNKYQEKMSYDVRGNITKMERNGFTGQNCIYPTGYLAGTFGKIDDMTYNYDGTNANKLISITDVVAGTAGKKGFA